MTCVIFAIHWELSQILFHRQQFLIGTSKGTLLLSLFFDCAQIKKSIASAKVGKRYLSTTH